MRPGDGSLAHASIAGDIAAVRMLLAANKDPDESLPPADTHDNRYTPLMWAASRRFVPIVQALLEAAADVNGGGALTALRQSCAPSEQSRPTWKYSTCFAATRPT
ncbi:ankyrin repeat domain-containing protein [Duganella sp. Leaf61]|uniref:ankyrin repeat domain-containing protein n=1 Tax=Duganella sp. Leaf61 TaxID=1736227 RepID=UPI0035A31721